MKASCHPNSQQIGLTSIWEKESTCCRVAWQHITSHSLYNLFLTQRYLEAHQPNQHPLEHLALTRNTKKKTAVIQEQDFSVKQCPGQLFINLTQMGSSEKKEHQLRKCPWAGGPGLYTKTDWASYGEQASMQHSSMDSASFPASKLLS